MAEDANARIRVDIDTAAALANIKNLQRQISTFHTSLAKSGAQATASSLQLQQSLINGINKTGQFSAGIKTIKTTTDSFTNSLQKNKLSMGEYFRYSAAATKSFGRFFSTEFDTINKVARERVKDLQTQYIKMGRDANGAMRAIAIRPLALDMESLATKTQIAAQRQALLNQMLKQGSTNLLNFGKNTQWAGRQLMVGFTVPLVMLGSVAAKTFMDMEKQAVRFKRVYGEMFTTTEETNKALQDIKNLANEFTKYGVAVSKTMELAADIAATGKMGADLTAQVAETTRLAVLGGVEQAEALQATISLTDAFGVSAEDLAGKIDFLNAVENQTITSIEDLTIAIPKAGPVVQQLGGDVEDLTFFLTAMREGGINASEGANALKSGLAALINPTGKASEMLAEFGINIEGIVEANAGDVKGLVIDFATALDTLDPLNRARAIEQLFGKFQFSRLSTLFQNVVKEGNQASRVLKLTSATTEELAVLSERELKRIEDSPMFKFQKALEDIKVTLVPLGEAFLKAVTPILEFGTKILEKFNNLDEGAKQFVVGLTAIAGVIGPVFLMGFGLIANGVANVIKGFVFFKTALNKAGSASTQLGMQTEYMTQQQLEAAAVAASLDQVHSKLKQTFTSEAAAINALTAAYERAILKQAAFAGTPMAVGRGAKSPKKLASGILSVPGPKGAGDVVPAMLSPGEAVIPADQAQKYRGFVAALISDKIPGFRFGDENVGSGLPKGFVKGYTNSVMYLPEKLNEEMKNDRPVSSSRVMDAIKESPAGVQGPLAGAIADNLAPGKSVEDTIKKNPNIKKFSETLSNNIVNRVAKVGPTITESQFQKIVQEEENKLAKKYGKVYQDTIRQQRKITSYENRQVRRIQSDGKSTAVGRQAVYDPEKAGIRPYSSSVISNRSEAAAKAMDPSFKKGDKRLSHTTAPRPINMRIMERMSRVLDKALSSSFLNSLRLQEQGKIQVATGRNKEDKRITLPVSATPEEQRKAKKEYLEKKKNTAEEKKTRQHSVAATKKETSAKKENAKTISKETKAKANATVPAGSGQSQKITARETKSGTRYYSGNRLAADQKAAQTTYNRQQGAARGVETRRANAAARAAAIPQASAAQPQQRGMMGGAGGTIGMIASGAVMAGSMLPGSAGQTAQGLLMPVMLASMILPMMGAFAPVVAALGALVIGAFALKGAFDSAEKAARETAMATGASTDSIRAFAEFAGKASAGEIMDKRRSGALEQFGIQTGKETFGNLFLQSEGAKPIIEGLKSSIASGVSSEALVGNTTNQLATAVASGALSRDQAASIAGSLGEAIGDKTFGIKVVGELNELIGIDGKNLLDNPVEVRVKLVEETNENLRSQIEKRNLEGAQGQAIAGGALTPALGVVGTLAGGLGGLAISSALAAGNFARIGALAGPIGAVAGGIAGAAVGAVMMYDGIQKAGAAAGSMNAQGIIALQQNQEMLDSLDLEYEKRIANARAAGDLLEVETLIGEQQRGRDQLLAANKDTIGMLVQQYSDADFFGVNPMGESLDKAIDSMNADNPLLQQVTTGARRAIEGSSGTAEQEYTLKLMLASGNVDPGTMTSLINVFGNDQETIQKIIDIGLNLGSADAGRAFALTSLFEDEVMKKDFIANINAKTPGDATKVLDMFETVQKTGGVLNMQVVLDAYMKDPEAGMRLVADLEEFKAAQEAGPIELSVIRRVFGQEASAAVLKDWEYFNSLDKDMQVTYMTLLQTAFETIEANPGDYDVWKETQGKGADTSQAAYSVFKANQGTEAAIRARTLQQEQNTPDNDGGGGGPAASSLDDILKKLRDVRKNQVNVTKGFEASANAINKLFGGGKGINLFSGLENDMRRLGAGEDLISLIAGMPPEEFAKKKNSLFRFNKQTGEIIGFKNQLKNIGKALSSIALGQYVNEQQKQAKESKNQVLAFNQLRSSGYSVAEAYEAIQDATIAAGIVAGDYTQKQIADTLASQRAAAEAAKQAARLTPEGLQDVFEEGFNKAMEAFDAQERQLTLEYEFKIADDQALIDQAQSQIAAIQYKLDDYEADLKGIEDQENEINKAYDEQLKAIEKVRKANQKVLDQEKGKLSVAEAITRGDLAGAARAVQEVRQASASGYFSSQTDALNAGRQSALDAARSENGLSRVEIEEQIKNLSNQIFEIEESTLEPATERVRLAGEALQKRIGELEVLDKTKEEWELIKASIDVARTNSVGYKDAIMEAEKIVQDVLDAWTEIEKPKQTVYTVKTVKEGDDGGGGGGGTGGIGGNNNVRTNDQAGTDKLNKQLQSLTNQIAGYDSQLKPLRERRDFLETRVQTQVVRDELSQVNNTIKGLQEAKSWTGKAVGDVKNQLKAADGGYISGPGTATSDSIPALLSNGEYVVKAASVSKLGRNFLDAINAGNLPRFREGGIALNRPSFNKPAFSKTSFGLPNMGTVRSPMQKISSGPRFNVPTGNELRKQIAVAQRPSQAPANNSSSVYNYSLSVNVASQSDPNAIAQTVMGQIRNIDSQRIRSNRF
jgi:TP901 family phage tail tape measure protein